MPPPASILPGNFSAALGCLIDHAVDVINRASTMPRMEAITELCQRMEGLPLAIELAAYQVKYYSPQAMLNLSNNRLDFLNLGSKLMPPHQQTIRAMLDWSFDLLTPELQNFFCRLSKFPASFTLSEAKSLGVIENAQAGLTALIDQSLLEQTPCIDGEPRFKMLGMVREYACEQLNKLQQVEKKVTFQQTA
jgi:predicted ATPase